MEIFPPRPHLHASALTCPRNELGLQCPLPAATRRGALHTPVGPTEHSGPPHVETKNCPFILLPKPLERGPWGWCPRSDHCPPGPRIPLGGVAAAAAAALCLPLVILVLPMSTPLPPRRGLPIPLRPVSLCLASPQPSSLPLPSIPAGPERADCANEDWALPGCPPQGWAPHACLATSCANVVPPPTWGWGAASTNWLEETTARPFPLLSSIMCLHPSLCSSLLPWECLPHINPPSCPSGRPPEPALFGGGEGVCVPEGAVSAVVYSTGDVADACITLRPDRAG